MIPSKLKSILDELKSIQDFQTRMDYLIEFGEGFKEVPIDIAKRPYPPESKVPACESDAFTFSKLENDGTIKFYFAVDNPHGVSAKALAVILDQGLSGETPAAVQEVPEEIVYDIFGKDLSMGKGVGLMGMIRLVKAIANNSKNVCDI